MSATVELEEEITNELTPEQEAELRWWHYTQDQSIRDAERNAPERDAETQQDTAESILQHRP